MNMINFAPKWCLKKRFGATSEIEKNGTYIAGGTSCTAGPPRKKTDKQVYEEYLLNLCSWIVLVLKCVLSPLVCKKRV